MSAIKSLVSATEALQGLSVEIENEALGKIKVKAALSCAKAGEIQQVKREDGQMKGICLEIAYRCCDLDDKPLFSKLDVITMMAEIDSDIITGLFIDMKDAIALEKSTATTQKSTST